MQKQNNFTILLVIVTVLSSPFILIGQSGSAQINNSTQTFDNTSTNVITPSQQNSNHTLAGVNQNSSMDNTKISFKSSGLCTLEGKVLHCELPSNTTGVVNNIILDESVQSGFPSISTSFRINEINETASNNVAVLYSLVDQPVEKYAGINIFNNSIYTLFYNFSNGIVTSDPEWPGQLTDLTWVPGTLFNMSVINQNDSVDLMVNGTTYYSQPTDQSYKESGYVGLYYDIISDIDFYSFINITASDSTVIQETETILLDGFSLPEESYLHLYDSTPYEIRSGHIAVKVPCNEDNSTDILLLAGQAPELNPVELEFVEPLSATGEICLYHGDIASTISNPITDIAIQNNSTEDNIEFPETSSIVISTSEIAKLSVN